MKKIEFKKGLQINILDNHTVFLKHRLFFFSYTVANSICKDEYKDQYRYFGGLQAEMMSEIEEKNLENWCCEICENVLNY